VILLTPNDSSITESLQGLKDNSVNIKYLEPKSGIIIKTILVYKKHSLVMELKDKEDRVEEEYSTIPKNTTKVIPGEPLVEIGTSTYSNSKPTVLSYLSVFEILWRQTELFEQLKTIRYLKDRIYQYSRS
jgi:two-component system, OmpR family, sensor histidine kinase VicK